ncbi:MAG: hypothetical protein IJM54_01005 [Thermoguttaceae bacterium]|nr:hypothetical protein [Thermoguttaceae bacterium]MBR4752878.1 hypothetical protein [Thermoguttaceae bacterium]
MELTVYRQSNVTRPDGTIVYKGEDALPIACSRLLLVADGMGGGAAIYHKNLNHELFDEDKLLDVLFNGVLPNYSDEGFADYVRQAFFELIAVRNCYFDNMKKSGYFGSRIVAALTLHRSLFNVDVEDNLVGLPEFFYKNRRTSPENEGPSLQALQESFTQYVAEKLRQVAKNANLIYESKIRNLALLGTTLCATLLYEAPDGVVAALYLTAGDSRPYVWSEEEGLCQVLNDQEGEDGGMTNYICANKDFAIQCVYREFKKPCVLFNASDGCFDSELFLSPMAFEKLILDKAVASNDEKEMGASLTELFYEYGRHDDSSTIAMKIFGYDSFQAFKESARRRLEKMNADYFSQFVPVEIMPATTEGPTSEPVGYYESLPDLLKRNYSTIYREFVVENFDDVKVAFEQEFEAVAKFCEERIGDATIAPKRYWNENYVEIIREILNDQSVPVSDDARTLARAALICLEQKEADFKNDAELQKRLFEQYERSYEKYL